MKFAVDSQVLLRIYVAPPSLLRCYLKYLKFFSIFEGIRAWGNEIDCQIVVVQDCQAYGASKRKRPRKCFTYVDIHVDTIRNCILKISWGLTFDNLKKPILTWRIIPVSKWLVTPIYKRFRPFGRGTTLVRGLTNHGY